MNEKLLSNARDLLRDATPLKGDCGAYCDSACCKDNGEAGSCVWLLPGEDAGGMDWCDVREVTMPASGLKMRAAYCKTPCIRELRPFLCRIFPLAPYYSEKQGKWSVRMDRRAAALCPLYGWGKKGLSKEFVRAAEDAVSLLSRDEEYRTILQALEREENAYRFEL